MSANHHGADPGNAIAAGAVVYARFSGDQYYYLARIDAIDEGAARVMFYDNYVETVRLTEIRGIADAVASMHAQGNWRNAGIFYPCRIIELSGDRFVVRYDQDGIVENVDLAQLRFV